MSSHPNSDPISWRSRALAAPQLWIELIVLVRTVYLFEGRASLGESAYGKRADTPFTVASTSTALSTISKISTNDNSGDDKLMSFALPLALAGHVGISRENKFRFVTRSRDRVYSNPSHDRSAAISKTPELSLALASVWYEPVDLKQPRVASK